VPSLPVQERLAQALLECVAAEIIPPEAEVVAIYSGFEAGSLDSVSVVRLEEHLAWRPQGDGYEHHHREPYGIKGHKPLTVEGGVMHLQWADWRRVVAKHALYKVVERVRWPKKYTDSDLDRIYGQALDETGAELAPVPPEWWGPYSEHMQHARAGSVPWQESEARRLYSPATMSGLNLFGVVK
jgi:hypothetical protein